MNWYLKVLKNYAGFEGRARRTEYWIYILVDFLITIGLIFLSSLLNSISEGLGLLGFILYLTYILATFLPTLAVVIRRLHDINKSGWMMLVALIPIIGIIWLIILLATEGEYGANGYGDDPKNIT